MHGLKRKTIPKIWKKVKSHIDAGEWKYKDGQEKATYTQKSLYFELYDSYEVISKLGESLFSGSMKKVAGSTSY